MLLVQAIASFDIRTRSGLYAGLALSGIVLFFASQHAFDLSFVVFLVGYAALLMAFLGTAAVEDETGAAQAPPSSHRIPLVRFWSGTAAAVLIFSALAFLLLPRGDSADPGYDQVAATGNHGLSQTQVTGRQESLPSPGAFSEQQDPVATGSDSYRNGAPQPSSDEPPGGATAGPESQPVPADDASPAPSTSANLNSLAMPAGSPKSSEQQQRSYDTFDGAAWHPATNLPLPRNSDYLSGSPESYGQAYLVNHAQLEGGSRGYGGVVEPSPDGNSSQNRVSHRLGTGLLDPVREKLSKGNPRQARYYSLPTSLQGLPNLTHEITAGAETDIDTVLRMVAFLRRHGQYDASTPDRLKSSPQLDDLVIDGEGGTDVDFAMAMVMLARAAGLPARLAVGYLPGERWAEIFFQEQGWVPIDSTPRSASMTVGSDEEAGKIPGLKYLFEAGIGDELLRGVIVTPSRLSAGFKEAINVPTGEALSAVTAGAIVAGLGWLGILLILKRRRRGGQPMDIHPPVRGRARRDAARLPTGGKILRKKGLEPRKPGQTVAEYARMAAGRGDEIEEQLAWFTEAAWEAAYNPRWNSANFRTSKMPEAKTRLRSLMRSLG